MLTPRTATPTILLATGDAECADAIVAAIGTAASPVRCSSLGSAIELAVDHGPAFVLLDLDGDFATREDILSACHRITTCSRERPAEVILLARSDDATARVAGFKAGASDVYSIPMDIEEMRARISVAIRHRTTADMCDLVTDVNERTAMRIGKIVDDQARNEIATREVLARALAVLAESRDAETGEHLDRMQAYTLILTEDLQKHGDFDGSIDHRFEEMIRHSAPLHDIGKVAIPDAILQKPGKLTADEFEIMKAHTETGARILEVIRNLEFEGGLREAADWLGMAVDIARSHHERWDGGGYPDGIPGIMIPVSARIVAVADVFDALTSARVYKDAMPLARAQSIIHEGTGSHFDPAIITAFDRSWDRFREVYHDFGHGCDEDERRMAA